VLDSANKFSYNSPVVKKRSVRNRRIAMKLVPLFDKVVTHNNVIYGTKEDPDSGLIHVVNKQTEAIAKLEARDTYNHLDKVEELIKDKAKRTDLEKWTKENNFLVSSLEGQLNFSIYEMQKMKFGKYSYAQFKKLKDVREATEVFEKHFERAGVIALDERIKYARETYNQYSKTKDRSS